MHSKHCPICDKDFETKYQCQNICSFSCRQEAQRERSRMAMRKKRNKRRNSFPPCEVCGYNKVTELHHESKTTHYLCPTHHALITRNYATLSEMLMKPNEW